MLAQGGYRFSHTLIRKVLCDELNSADRSALHLKIGEAFEELYQADAGAHAAVLAHHFREGGDIDRAIHYSIRAGEAARRMFAYEEAVAHWRYALELMAHRAHGREGRAGQVEWLSGRGPASIIAGDGTASALQGNAHPPPTSQNASATESARAAVFRREGDYWTLSWAGLETRLRHRKGMQHIARLLRYPGEEIAADMLAAVPLAANGSKAAVTEAAYQTGVSVVRGLGNCGAPLDSVAKAQYRRRLHDLRSELEEAQNLNDLGRAGKAREEIEFIEAEVCASLGLRGRDRMQVSHTERARLAVTKAIKVALTRIRQAHPELGRHLAVSIQTGYFCAYMSAQPVNWQL